MKTSRWGIPVLFATLCLAALAGPIGSVRAQCGSVRGIVGGACIKPVVVAKPVVAVAAVHHAAPVVLVPKAVPVAVAHDSYYSASDGYRDSVIADAAALRALKLLAAQQLAAKVPASVPDSSPVPRMKEAPPDAPAPAPDPKGKPLPKSAGGVPAGLAAVVERSCIKCHAGSGASGKNGIGLDDLAAVPSGLRWKSFGLVNSGEMPKGGKALEDAESQLFYEWAKGAAPTDWPVRPGVEEVSARVAAREPEPRINARRRALMAARKDD